MEHAIYSVILIAAMFLLLGGGLWVALALLGVGFIGMELFSTAPSGRVLATTVWGSGNSWALASLPLFIWMGEILFRSKVSEEMFSGLAPWLGRLPGRLLHVNILGCGIFAAVSGSSAATAATIGKMSVPELRRRGYDENMVIGTLAGSGTLGLLIPPSIIMIVYGVATEESIARLFVAGVLPGVMLMALFMGYVAVWALLNPAKVPPADPVRGWREKVKAARNLIPTISLIVGVIGSIYAGFASPTDAAAVGVAIALFLSWRAGTLDRRTFVDGLMGATRTSCMIAFILAGAAFLSVAMGFTGIPAALAKWISTLNLSPAMLIAALTVFFIILGCFLDGISMVVLTTSVIMPMVEAAGIDRLWFGIYIVLVVEMAQITPPVGFNLFVLQGLTGRDILSVGRASFSMFLLMILAVVLIYVFPEIVSFLPAQMGYR
ncbi:MAG: TRAP transporter large permease subunit [Alphaproteobacteria bacterium]|nr:TRAP transporter large permease subunit [Alphaproteobacteria bacterium]